MIDILSYLLGMKSCARPSGSGESSNTDVVPLSVTENGEYTAPAGTAYSPVTVNVEGESSDVVATTDVYTGTIETIISNLDIDVLDDILTDVSAKEATCYLTVNGEDYVLDKNANLEEIIFYRTNMLYPEGGDVFGIYYAGQELMDNPYGWYVDPYDTPSVISAPQPTDACTLTVVHRSSHDIETGTLSVTENGSYNAQVGTAYNRVEVNVESENSKVIITGTAAHPFGNLSIPELIASLSPYGDNSKSATMIVNIPGYPCLMNIMSAPQANQIIGSMASFSSASQPPLAYFAIWNSDGELVSFLRSYQNSITDLTSTGANKVSTLTVLTHPMPTVAGE